MFSYFFNAPRTSSIQTKEKKCLMIFKEMVFEKLHFKPSDKF